MRLISTVLEIFLIYIAMGFAGVAFVLVFYGLFLEAVILGAGAWMISEKWGEVYDER
jgi:hypothetical protein